MLEGYLSETELEAEDVGISKDEQLVLKETFSKIDSENVEPHGDTVLIAHDQNGVNAPENSHKQKQAKRRRSRKRYGKRKKGPAHDATSIEYMGPWAKSDSSDMEEDALDEEEIQAPELPAMDQKTTEEYTLEDYMEQLKKFEEPGSFQLPKSKVVLRSHTRGVTRVRLLKHLVLSSGNDGKIFLWSLTTRALLRGFFGHALAVKDVLFNQSGDKFLSAGLDKKVILWSTGTGEILHQLHVEAVPNAVIFNPNNENEVVVGVDRKIVHFDLSVSDTPIQVYDHHLGSINSLTVVDSNTKFMSTADDRTIRIWEWQVNIPAKIISEPTQHSTPSAVVHPTENFILLQMMDNSIQTIQGSGKFRYNRNKTFTGHRVAGYGVQIAVSSDGQVVVSGDANGYVYFWSWKTGRVLQKMKLSDQVISCVDVGQGVVAAGSSGDIFYLE